MVSVHDYFSEVESQFRSGSEITFGVFDPKSFPSLQLSFKLLLRNRDVAS